MDKSVFEVILSTCKRIEIPPKPNKNAVKIILRENFLQVILEIILIPLVISKNPLKRGEMKLVSILKKLNKGEKVIVAIFNKPLAFTIEMILEKITTNPPIKSIVEMLLVMLSANTSPKLEKETVDFLLELISLLFLDIKPLDILFLFQKRKTIPTEIHPNM